jgi:hypothetical protein
MARIVTIMLFLCKFFFPIIPNFSGGFRDRGRRDLIRFRLRLRGMRHPFFLNHELLGSEGQKYASEGGQLFAAAGEKQGNFYLR